MVYDDFKFDQVFYNLSFWTFGILLVNYELWLDWNAFFLMVYDDYKFDKVF